MKFISLKLENFMSHKDTHIQLNDLGLVGVEGKNNESGYTDSNGAGKSAIIEALVWCLFGNTIRSLKDKEDVVNRTVGKNCSVMIELVQGEFIYRIIRTRQHSKAGNSLIVYQAEDPSFAEMKDLTRANVSDTQLFVDRLLGLEYQSFINAIVFGQGDIKHFSQATDAERKSMFEKLLDLEIYSYCLEVAKEHYEIVDNNIETLDRDIESIDTQKLRLNNELEDLRERAERFLKEHESKIQTMEEQLVSLVDPTDAITRLQEKIQNQLVLIQDKRKAKDEVHEKLEEEIRKQMMKIATADSQIRDHDRRIQKFQGLEGTCPVLEIPCDRIDVQKNETLMNNVKEEIESLRSARAEVAKKVQELTDNLNLIEGEVQSTLDRFDQELSEFQRSLRELTVQDNQRKNLIRQIDEAKNFQEPYSELIERKLGDLEGLDVKKAEKQNLRKVQDEQLEGLKFWINGFGLRGIKSLILDDVVPYINERLDYYSGKLTDKDILISLSTTSQLKSGGVSEKINLQIENQSGGGNYESCSAGERRRIDACLLFALLDLAMQKTNPCNILFIDEIFDVLDEVGVENLINLLLLKIRDEGLESIFVISHNREILRSLPNTFKVVKEKGFSRIIGG